MAHPPYPPPPPYPPHLPRGPAPKSGPAIASLVLGCVSLAGCFMLLVTPFIGLVLGTIGLQQTQRRERQGPGLAIAGLVTNGIAIALVGLMMLDVIFGEEPTEVEATSSPSPSPSASASPSPSPSPSPSDTADDEDEERQEEETPPEPEPVPETEDDQPGTGGGSDQDRVQGVHPGAYCDEHWQYGYTEDGTLMQCTTTATDDRFRWRSA
nr:DUF4190 domain-containing protein [Nocardiopsis baichengensis]